MRTHTRGGVPSTPQLKVDTKNRRIHGDWGPPGGRRKAIPEQIQTKKYFMYAYKRQTVSISVFETVLPAHFDGLLLSFFLFFFYSFAILLCSAYNVCAFEMCSQFTCQRAMDRWQRMNGSLRASVDDGAQNNKIAKSMRSTN